jgi:DnaK suppressor protein
MPNSNKFNKKDLESYRGLLLKMKEELLHDIENMSHNPVSQDKESVDVSGHVQHMADVATDMYDKEFNLGLASKDRELLVRIEAALKRIEDGTYGLCLATKKSISKERLKAIPYVEYCLEYQEGLESKRSK